MKKNQKEEFPLGLDFFSMFVHELKSPLMSLKFQLDQLKNLFVQEESQKEIKNHLSLMEENLIYLFQFVDDSLDMKELEDQNPLQLKWCSWKEILERNKTKLKEWSFKAQVKVEILPCSRPIEVYVDPRWIDSAISNLLLNSIQHSPKNGRIQLKTQYQSDNSILFSIVDEGAGIDDHLKDKLFHRFQSFRKKQSHLKGTGLGLFIAKNIIEGHGGKIGVHSHSKKLYNNNLSGCAFFFTLPQARYLKLKQAI